MTPLAWMAGAGVGAWLLVRALSGGDADPEVGLGMAGPLACALASWVAYRWAHRTAPGRLTTVMVAALAAKMVFFAGYVAVVLRGFGLRPAPFAVSFAGFFIALHAMEALFLRRLLVDDLRSPGRERT